MFEILKGNQHLLRIIFFILIASIGILTLSILFPLHFFSKN